MKFSLLSLLLMISAALNAQIIVSPDSSFAINGRSAIEVGISSSGESGMGRRTIKVLADGKMIIATTSKINEFNSNRNYWIARTLEDGSLDQSFGTQGEVLIFSGNDGVGNSLESIDIDSQGRILICGQRKDPFTIIEEAVIMRLLPNGTIDEDFGNNGETVLRLSPINSYTSAQDIKVLTDGKSLVLTTVRNSSTSPVGLGTEFSVTKLKADGNRDSTFGVNGVLIIADDQIIDSPSRIVIQADGKIILAGKASVTGAGSKFKFIRLNADGSLDNSFGNSGIAIIDRGTDNTPGLNDVFLKSDGKILATGHLLLGISSQLTLVQLNEDGTLDLNFNESGFINIPSVDIGNKILVDNDGNIFTTGRVFNEVVLAKVTAIGLVDQDFGNSGVGSLGIVNPSSSDLTAAFANDGKIIIGGAWRDNGNDFYSLVKVKFVDSSLPNSIENYEPSFNQFYPNPANENLSVHNPENINFLSITDCSGKSVFSTYHTDGTIDLSDIPNGIYFISIQRHSEKSTIHKFIIHN